MLTQSEKLNRSLWLAMLLCLAVVLFVPTGMVSAEQKGPAPATQPAASQQSEGSTVKLTVPKAPWTVFISGEALVVKVQEVKPDGSSGYFALVDDKAQMVVSLYIERVDRCNT